MVYLFMTDIVNIVDRWIEKEGEKNKMRRIYVCVHVRVHERMWVCVCEKPRWMHKS